MFPIITEKLQAGFEAQCKGVNPTTLPMICGVYGRACRQMGKTEGANRFNCTHCPLMLFAEKQPVAYDVSICGCIYTVEADNENEAKTIACDAHYEETGQTAYSDDENVVWKPNGVYPDEWR